MIKTLSKQVINGTLKLVETVLYSNGTRVIRILDPKTLIPTDVIRQ